MFKVKLNTNAIARIALLVSISIVIKMLLSGTTSSFRISFYELPIIISGIMYGPILGGLTGFVVDVLYIVFHPMATSFNLMTVSSILWGVLGGVFFFTRKDLTSVRIITMLVVTSILTFLLNSYQLYYIWDLSFADLPLRLGIMLVKLPIQFYTLDALYKRVVKPELDFKKKTI